MFAAPISTLTLLCTHSYPLSLLYAPLMSSTQCTVRQSYDTACRVYGVGTGRSMSQSCQSATTTPDLTSDAWCHFVNFAP